MCCRRRRTRRTATTARCAERTASAFLHAWRQQPVHQPAVHHSSAARLGVQMRGASRSCLTPPLFVHLQGEEGGEAPGAGGGGEAGGDEEVSNFAGLGLPPLPLSATHQRCAACTGLLALHIDVCPALPLHVLQDDDVSGGRGRRPRSHSPACRLSGALRGCCAWRGSADCSIWLPAG